MRLIILIQYNIIILKNDKSQNNIATERSRLLTLGFIDLKDQVRESSIVTLYKCDYDFTLVEYVNSTSRFIQTPTIFDSENSSGTIVHEDVVDYLGLPKIPITIQVNNLMNNLRLLDKIIPSNDGLNYDEITMEQFILKIDEVSEQIRKYYKLSPNDDNEDLLEYFYVKIPSK